MKLLISTFAVIANGTYVNHELFLVPRGSLMRNKRCMSRECRKQISYYDCRTASALPKFPDRAKSAQNCRDYQLLHESKLENLVEEVEFDFEFETSYW